MASKKNKHISASVTVGSINTHIFLTFQNVPGIDSAKGVNRNAVFIVLGQMTNVTSGQEVVSRAVSGDSSLQPVMMVRYHLWSVAGVYSQTNRLYRLVSSLHFL